MRHRKQPLLPAPSPPSGTILLATQSTQAWQYRSSMDALGPGQRPTPGLTSLRVQADTLPASPCKSLPYGTSCSLNTVMGMSTGDQYLWSTLHVPGAPMT